MTFMLVVEAATEKKHDDVIREYTSAIGMPATFLSAAMWRAVSFPTTEGMSRRAHNRRAALHDENARAGHAGSLSEALDTAKFKQMNLNLSNPDGTYGGKRMLSQSSVDLIFTNFNAWFADGSAHGVGFELNQSYTAGPMANLLAASHTRIAGTSLVVDRSSGTVFVHLANRVHPSRNWSRNNVARETLGA
ncbi:hypothetical protein LLEC1_06759 [Akanthomyces lecanii]|uniref:Beta-lactamase-related domain-containing protein n=1 Tax=Cordyceps confragosa TaxID=2714763 RepID=A0A179ILL1_CORDF|nr:hypothetical protein LLEC1_06759 [Akanthomyces lecanii]